MIFKSAYLGALDNYFFVALDIEELAFTFQQPKKNEKSNFNKVKFSRWKNIYSCKYEIN